jgi:ATP phosphoribosyltransferase
MITLALSKGRIFEETLPLLKAANIEVLEDPEKSRKLILATNQPDVRVLVVRATDVPTYVQYGGADLGITGKDTLIEHAAEWGGSASAAGLYQPLDLQIAKCRISVAVRADFDYASAVKQGSRLRVATTGLADAIVDLVSTGNTLKANHLVEVEHIMDISSRLIVNQAALKLKQAPLKHIIDAFASAVALRAPAPAA